MSEPQQQQKQQEQDQAPASPFSHGQVCYLQIPARDIQAAGDFYRAVFGWQVDPGESGFTAPGVIGQWVLDRATTAKVGTMLWILVGDIQATFAAARRHGGAVLEEPTQDGPNRTLATIADVSGYAIGIFTMKHLASTR